MTRLQKKTILLIAVCVVIVFWISQNKKSTTSEGAIVKATPQRSKSIVENKDFDRKAYENIACKLSEAELDQKINMWTKKLTAAERSRVELRKTTTRSLANYGAKDQNLRTVHVVVKAPEVEWIKKTRTEFNADFTDEIQRDKAAKVTNLEGRYLAFKLAYRLLTHSTNLDVDGNPLKVESVSYTTMVETSHVVEFSGPETGGATVYKAGENISSNSRVSKTYTVDDAIFQE